MSSLAGPTTVTFIHDFGANGFVKGSFTGEDVDLDGKISFDDSVVGIDTVTAYSIQFTPGSASSGDISVFTLGLPLLDRLDFAIGGGVAVVAGGEDGGTEHFYNCIDEFNCSVGDVDNIYSSGGANVVTSANRPYEFTALRSEARRINQTSFSTPTINNNGVAAYVVSSSNTDRKLIIDDGTTQTVFDLYSAAGGVSGFLYKVFINDQGAVAVVYHYLVFSFPRRGILLRFNPDNSVDTLATYNSDGMIGDFRDIDGRFISMNNSGQIGANIILNSEERAIVIIDDDGYKVVDTTTQNRFSFAGSAINDAGVVAYRATEAVPSRVAVFSGNGLSPSQIALTFPGCGGSSIGPDINDNGLIAGSSPLCLLTGAGGVVSEVVVDAATTPFHASVRSLSLNKLGEVVFSATTDQNVCNNSGLYFGDDPVHDKLIQQGEPLFGERVGHPNCGFFGQAVRFSGDGGMNDQGQVVFLAATVSDNDQPTTHVVRADPQGVADIDSDGDGILDADDNCPDTANSDQTNTDGDAEGDACDLDDDGDGVLDESDNCPLNINPGQDDFDGDGAGDYCDSDNDSDEVLDAVDACLFTPAGAIINANGCAIADLCPCIHPDGTDRWKNHGKYVSCVVHAANDFRDAGLIGDSEHGGIISDAGQSACGVKN